MVIIRISEIYTSEMGVSAVWCGCGAWGSFKASRSNIWREERCWCIPSGKGTRLQCASFEVGKVCITQNKPCTRLLRSPLCLPYRLQNILINHLLIKKLKAKNSVRYYVKSAAYSSQLCINLCPRLLSVS